MILIIWTLLTAIGVSDAQRHRIPNNLVFFRKRSPVPHWQQKSVIISTGSHFAYWVIIPSGHADCMTKKKSKFSSSPPIASDINEANALISELWEQLRHYEDRLQTSSANSSKSPSSDGPKERAERKKLKALVVAIREELNKVTKGINDNSQN